MNLEIQVFLRRKQAMTDKFRLLLKNTMAEVTLKKSCTTLQVCYLEEQVALKGRWDEIIQIACGSESRKLFGLREYE